MFNFRRLGSLIGWSFAVILIITTIIGGVGVLAMRSAQSKAHEMEDSEIPAMAAAGDIEIRILEMMYRVRSWTYTHEPALLAEGRQHITALTDEVLPAAEKLATAQGLAVLGQTVTKIKDGLATYAGLVTQTERIVHELETLKQDRINAALAFLAEAEAFKNSQIASLEQEVAATTQAAVTRRAKRIDALIGILQRCYDIRITVFIGEGARDPGAAAKTVPLFTAAEGAIADLLSDTARQENKDRLARMRASLDVYRASITRWAAAVETMNTLGMRRQEIAEAVLAEAVKAGEVNRAKAVAAADASVGQLSSSTLILAIGLAIAIVVGSLFARRIGRSISMPVIETARVLGWIASGDFRTGMSSDRKDELGDMARSVDRTVNSLRDTLHGVKQSSIQVGEQSQGIANAALQVAHASEETSSQIGVVAASTEEINASVSTVATSAQEMATSIEEISHHANEVSRIAREANERAVSASEEMRALQSASERIGGIVKLISSIAEQTNLLALNATIEAARAGDAGRGFAVVASEVKSLATQTAQATRQIVEMVQDIQTRSGTSHETIASFVTIVQRITELQQSVASAVEEQTATTKEITANVQEVARGVQQITENMAGVQSAAKLSSDAAGTAQSATHRLQTISGELQKAVEHFSLS